MALFFYYFITPAVPSAGTVHSSYRKRLSVTQFDTIPVSTECLMFGVNRKYILKQGKNTRDCTKRLPKWPRIRNGWYGLDLTGSDYSFDSACDVERRPGSTSEARTWHRLTGGESRSAAPEAVNVNQCSLMSVNITAHATSCEHLRSSQLRALWLAWKWIKF